MSTEPMASTQNGTEICYAVEARNGMTFMGEPLVTNILDEVGRTFVLSTEWRRVPIRQGQGPVGVPNRLYESYPVQGGYLSYEAAMAMAYWFVAACDQSSIEVRLVRHKHEYTHSITRIGAGPLIKHGIWVDRESWLPDAVDPHAQLPGTPTPRA